MSLRKISEKMSESDVKVMLREYDFFDSRKNKKGKGMLHRYLKIDSESSESIILDLSTGLMWQQGGSDYTMNYEGAKKWIAELNQAGYAGYKDWRLPTLEEAMSQMEPEKKHGDLYINPMFDAKQRWIWTCDLVIGESRAWIVGFDDGGCLGYAFDYDDLFNNASLHYVRAVRSGQSSKE